MLEDQHTEGTGTDCAAQIQQHLTDASTAELETELSELILDESDSDDTIDLIQAYLKELDSRSPVQEDAAGAEEAYQSFCEKHQDLVSETAPKHRRVRPVRLIAIAAVIVVMVVLLVAPASGANLFSILARWTKDAFGFSYSGDTETPAVLSPVPGAEYSDLWEALDAYGITEPVAPKYIPEGYEQIELYVNRKGSSFRAVYTNNVDTIVINIHYLQRPTVMGIQKESKEAIVYELNGIRYYIMRDKGIYSATWVSTNYACEITNVASEELLYTLLNYTK